MTGTTKDPQPERNDDRDDGEVALSEGPGSPRPDVLEQTALAIGSLFESDDITRDEVTEG